jgi:hypothetical protein
MPRRPWLTARRRAGLAGLTIQLYLVLLARWQAQASLIGGLVNLFCFFTVLQHVGGNGAQPCRVRPRRPWQAVFPVTRGQLAVAASIVLVALAYSVLLRHLWQPQGWQWLADELLHDVMPVLYALYWWREVPKGRLRLGHLALWAVYPTVYFGYALWRGSEIGVYAYPFIDVASLGVWAGDAQCPGGAGGVLGNRAGIAGGGSVAQVDKFA